MKRKIIVSCLLIGLCLSACGRTANTTGTTSATSPDVVRTATTASNEVSDVEIDQPEAVGEEPSYSVKELCDLYLSGKDIATDQYIDKGDGWIELTDSYATYYPGAVYPNAKWDPDAVLQSYYDATAPWISSKYDDDSQLWSQDYEHHFSVDDDWFRIDDIRVKPLAEGHRIAPEDLLKAYQSGEWDGEWRWSEDYGTKVRLNWYDGSLYYCYHAHTYTEERDPMHLAYTGYEDVPEYMDGGYGLSVHDSSGSTYDFSTVVRTHYLDLPNGNLEDWIDLVRIEDVGSYVILSNAIEHYYQGEKIQSWEIDFSEDSFIAPRWNDGAMFVYADGKVLQLKDNGKTEVVLDDIVQTSYGFESTFYALTLHDGLLQCREIFSGNDTEIATNVIDINISDDGAILFEDDQHCVYALISWYNDGACYLGSDSIEFYNRELSEFDGNLIEFAEQYN